MSDMGADMVRRLQADDVRLRLTETKEVALIGSGAAFPASPATNRLFFRTDLGWWCYYDGTRWLTVHEYHIPQIVTNYVQTAIALAGAGETALRTDFAPYFTRYAIQTNAAATNNGTNFWTITFRTLNSARSATTTLVTFTTAGDTAGAVVSRDAAPSTPNPANFTIAQVVAQGTLAPGALTIYSASLFYRFIVP